MGRLRPLQISLRSANLFLRCAYRSFRASQLRGQFRYFQHRDRLALPHVVTDVDINLADVTRQFRVHIHVLKRLELAGDGQRAAHVVALYARPRGRRYVPIRINVMDARLRRAPPEPNRYQHANGEEGAGSPEPFFIGHRIILSEARRPASYSRRSAERWSLLPAQGTQHPCSLLRSMKGTAGS